MDVSVIIVNYNTSTLVAECVKSILTHTQELLYEVIVVDNNSEPDFQQQIVSALPNGQPSHLQFLRLQENIGFGRANNEGLKLAAGRNIFFLNPDTVLLNNAIKILSDFLDRHPGAGACGGNLYDENLMPAFSLRRMLPGILWEFNELTNTLPQKILYGKNNYFNHSSKDIEVGFISGADLMVKREVLQKTGAFSPDFFLYYEETDLCSRIKKAGWKIYNVPQAKVQHLEGQSTNNAYSVPSDFKTKWMEKSREIYYRRNLAPLARYLSNVFYRTFLLSRILLLKNQEKKSWYRSRLLHHLRAQGADSKRFSNK